MDDTTPLTPLIFNAVQNTYITQISELFSRVSHEAASLFYVLAALEIAFFGIIWAIKQEEMVGRFLFKLMKLGFIFFLITHYASLLNILLNGLTNISFSLGQAKITHLMSGPDVLWKYGFDSAISLLSLAVQYGNANIGMTFIYLILGFGILFLFALIACQVILLVLSFYIISLLALLLLPFGTFTLTENFLTQALHTVFKTAVKIFALTLILGIGVGIWASFNPSAFVATTTLDQPLGLLFATLIIAILSWKVPQYVAETVGYFGGSLFGASNATSGSATSSVAASPSVNVTTGISQVAAATTLNVATSLNSPSLSVTSSGTGAASSLHGSNYTPVAGVGSLNKNVSELLKAVKIQKEGPQK
jgi:type IV secretion system protein TrbL